MMESLILAVCILLGMAVFITTMAVIYGLRGPESRPQAQTTGDATPPPFYPMGW